MRLVTWNVNSLKQRFPRVLELLDQHAPDVLALQETKVVREAFPHAEFAAVGYRAVEHSEGRWNGVALLTPVDVEVVDVQAGLPGEPSATEARWIEATVGDVRVVSVYVPNGREPRHPMFQAKLAFLDAMRTRVPALVGGGPTVIAGDFNIAPEDRDVWDPAFFVGSTHVTRDERDRLAAILDCGLVDAFRVAEPDAVGFTWWDYRAGAFHRGMGMRLDLALVSHHLDVAGCMIDTTFRRLNLARDKPSDHAPLVIDLTPRAA